MNVIEIGDAIPRHAEGISCPCGGYADQVACTPDEIKKHGCGRSYECCSCAFVCRVCESRLVGTFDAQERRD